MFIPVCICIVTRFFGRSSIFHVFQLFDLNSFSLFTIPPKPYQYEYYTTISTTSTRDRMLNQNYDVTVIVFRS